MLKLVLFLFLTVIHTLSLTPAERILKCDKNIMKIIEKPHEDDANKLMHIVNKYISIIKSTTEDFEKDNKNMFKICKEIRVQGWPDFLSYDYYGGKYDELKEKFKWNNTKLEELEEIMEQAEIQWFYFMDCFDRVTKSKKMH